MGRNSKVRKAGRHIKRAVKSSPGHQIAQKITGRRGKSQVRNQAVKTAQQSANQQGQGQKQPPQAFGGGGKGKVNPTPKPSPKKPNRGIISPAESVGPVGSTSGGEKHWGNSNPGQELKKNKSSQKPVPGRGRGKGNRPIAPNENRRGGGGYRNKAFGMGRQQRGYGMGGEQQRINEMMNFSPGPPGPRGFGMGAAEAAAQKGWGSQMGERSFGRPNPYASKGRGQDAQGNQGTFDMQGNFTQSGGGRPQGRPAFIGANPYAGGAFGQPRGGGGRPQAPSSSFNPQSGRMEYTQTPNNFSRSSQRPTRGGFAGRRAAAFPNMMTYMSDVRMKEKIQRMGTSPSGIPIYEFNYIGDNNRYSGVMAQDLIEMNIDAVSMDDSGFYTVNYNNIDVDMHLIN